MCFENFLGIDFELEIVSMISAKSQNADEQNQENS